MKGSTLMAMKLNSSEKQADNFIRSLNKQIEKAYKDLGYNHPVTRNLVHTAKAIVGKDNIKYMSQKSYKNNQTDMSTGEVHEIPQISRTRKALNAMTKTQYKVSPFNGRRYETTALKDLQGQYYTSRGIATRYDVTKAHQKAIEREMQRRRIEYTNTHKGTGKKFFDEVDKYQRAFTEKELNKQLYFDVIASDIFEKYKHAKDNGDEDIDDYIMFADMYNHGDNIEDFENIVQQAMVKRDETLHNMAYTDEQLEQELSQGQSLLNYMDLL